MGFEKVAGTLNNIGSAIQSSVSSSGPLSRGSSYATNYALPNLIPGLPELISMFRYGFLTQEDVLTLGRFLGLEEQYTRGILYSSQQTLGAADFISMHRRGQISGSELQTELQKIGYDISQLRYLELATEYQPTPPDIIQFAVREVYNKGETSKWEQFTAPPPEYVTAAKKAGLSEVFANQYWWAHWKLPSVEQSFDFLHRGLIDTEEMSKILKAQDIMPGFINHFIKASYHPLTRVDIRRMYAAGVIDRARVKQEYMDGGYDEERAELITVWLERDVGEDVAGISKTQVLAAYEEGLNTLEETIVLLTKLNIAPEAQNLLLELSDYKITKYRLDLLVAELSGQFEMKEVSIHDIRSQLSEAGAPDSYIDRAMGRIIGGQKSKTRLPSRTDLERWYEKELLDDSLYFAGMIALGYSRDNARMYMAEILYDKEVHKRKFLSASIYKSWLKLGILSVQEWQVTGSEMGLNQSDIDNLVKDAFQHGQDK